MKILLDADGCPVVHMSIALAQQYGVEVILFCDTSHLFRVDAVEVVTVGKGADSADLALVSRIVPGDVVVTQDYGLAAMCLAKRALVMNQDGLIYHAGNIDALLYARHTAKKIRRAGGRLKGSVKRKKEQDQAFAKNLETVLNLNEG